MQPITRLFSLILTTVPLMMKKTYILLIVLLMPLAMFGQLSGDGSFSDPYSGTLEQIDTEAPDYPDTTWAGTVYIEGDVTIDDEELMISSGTNIIFVAENADLIITGTGQLTADGTSSSKITFTADDDDDGNYGETGERWGHISFQSMGAAGVSIIDYCIIEFGDVSGNSGDPASFGGGIHVNFSNLTISNSIIRDNKALYGGGIFVNKSKNPTINNCHLYDNIANNGGGGIYLWFYSYPLIENCIIEKNTCSSSTYGGGGLFLGPQTGTAKIINCTIVNNTALNGYGSDVFFFSTESSKLINSVIWGDNNSIYFYGSNSSDNLVNCAVERAYNSSGTIAITNFTNCIDLNSSNSASDGPNFVNPTSDYSITVASPCLDAGTDTDAPSTDYDGTNRISPYDIGAYEVTQYSRWTGATSNVWNLAGNWDVDGLPTISDDVVIPSGKSNYPTSSSTQDFAIGSGKYMIVGPGAQVTLDELTNNGTLTLKSDANGIASLMVDTYTDNGTENIELFITGGDAGTDEWRWHYISIPVSSISTDIFSGTTDNLLEYRESLVDDDGPIEDGWNWFDEWEGDPGFSDLTLGNGYNFYHSSDHTFTFSGSINTTNKNISLDYASGASTPDPDIHGFNLLGNPFSSGLDWDVIIDDVSYPANTSKGLYFTSDNAQCTYINDVGVPSHVTGIIPPMQGFFTKTYSTGNTINLLASARTHNSIHARYKGKSTIPLVRLSILQIVSSTSMFTPFTTKDSLSDETVVRFAEQAKPELDNDFDAVKMFLSDDKLSIYSYDGETKYAINGLPFPENSVDIPLVINSPQADTLKIIATQIQGLEDYDLILKDMEQDFNINELKYNEYIFFADSGTVTDRFVLTITKQTTGLPDIFDPEPEKAFNIYSSHGILYINPAKNEWNGRRTNLRIFDITGKLMKHQQNIEWQKDVTKEIPLSVAQGIYLVEICSATERFVGRVSVVK